MAWPWGACWGSGLGPGVPVGGTVFGGFGGFWEHLEGLESFGAFAGWQTAALKAHRKPLLWPGLGVPVGEVALALGCLLGKWPWPWGACWEDGVWRVWRVLGAFGGFGEFRSVCFESP